jgi:hypothetical protein
VSTKKSTLERTVVIENMEPCIDGGHFPVKRIVGQELKVSADVSKNGHDQLSVVLKWRKIRKARLASDADGADRKRSMGGCLSLH